MEADTESDEEYLSDSAGDPELLQFDEENRLSDTDSEEYAQAQEIEMRSDEETTTSENDRKLDISYEQETLSRQQPNVLPGRKHLYEKNWKNALARSGFFGTRLRRTLRLMKLMRTRGICSENKDECVDWLSSKPLRKLNTVSAETKPLLKQRRNDKHDN
ncbi:hypothetical protein BG003_001477 [Podila horticola]|nr:hypothetical protein BG003_001477 [Podila horticola]